ncbi:hypothetical protein MUK70_18090 [Dyadobacter chenwenxiniae]|uniref:Lipoprotein n=1 Tax=Dyadobacter chenwenxiniae TaxID=2906456 RepID=A0A9X1TDI5_9BACT|nr:hypothetical protein [Dyadobacter chenwenxiniae]MCF0061152.1 hypothetical protein [Dyadobacter chenwenxiniae]UON80979.1 hypothetical protein MUK70_18090 [Dyadobacter chenwenxiniae]
MNQIFKSSLQLTKVFLFVGLISITAFSCRTAELAVDNDLKNESEIYSVKGRQGSQIGQVISFGNFKTSKVQRGWTSGYSIPFIVKFNGAKEKLSFQQLDLNGKTADVTLVSRFRETEYQPLQDHFSVSLKYKNYFAGAIKPLDSDEAWEFVVHNVDGSSRSLNKNRTAGFVRSRHTRIDIAGIRELEGSSSFLTQNDVYGYEFQLEGKIIGAVSTINNGKVWLKKGLSDEIKLILASVSSGLMLRSPVEENAIAAN